MILFIDFLKTLATCLITNAHYTGIYPTDLLANGGLLGDVLFFAVSGYCLYHVKGSFVQWYGKRIVRCYLPVLLITAVYMLLGAYSLKAHSAFWWLVYPTYYHFVASIVVLYVPYFIIMKIEALRARIPQVMCVIFVIYLAAYVFGYDKTYYHIDTVREPFIRFLFMECMLLGAYFRREDHRYRNRFSGWKAVAAGFMMILYFAGKLLLVKIPALACCQILNQMVLFALLYLLFSIFSGLDERLEKSPVFLRRMASFLSGITLEIYVVQYVLIDIVRSQNLIFPINWLCLTGVIILAAHVLHLVCGLVGRGVSGLVMKTKK